MTENEIRDYELLKKIQELCDSAKNWEGNVCFETVWQSCSNQIRDLKIEIGERIIEEYKNEIRHLPSR